MPVPTARGFVDRQFHSLCRGDMTEAFAPVENGHRGRLPHGQDLGSRIDATLIDRVEIPPNRPAAMRVDSPQVGFDQPRGTDSRFGFVHPFGFEHADQKVRELVCRDDDFLRGIGWNIERFGHHGFLFLEGTIGRCLAEGTAVSGQRDADDLLIIAGKDALHGEGGMRPDRHSPQDLPRRLDQVSLG